MPTNPTGDLGLRHGVGSFGLALGVEEEGDGFGHAFLASGRYGTLYIGVTSDLMGRLWQHRNNALPGFTSRYGVNRLVHFEMSGDMKHAIAREKQLKNWRREWKINLINGENPEWRDLAVGLGFKSMAPRLRRNGS